MDGPKNIDRPFPEASQDGFGDRMGARPQVMGLDLPTGNDPASIRRRIEAMEHMLERSFRIPGVNYPVGLDSIIGLVPVIGDFVTAAMGAYIVWEARNLGMPKWKLWRMGGNIAFDSLLGAVPLVGRCVRSRLPVEHPQPADHQAASRQASSGAAHDRRLSFEQRLTSCSR